MERPTTFFMVPFPMEEVKKKSADSYREMRLTRFLKATNTRQHGLKS